MEGSAGVAASRSHALDVLEEHCRRDPGTVVDRLLARLRARADAVAAVVPGMPLYVRLTVDESPSGEQWLVFTGNGHVGVIGEESLGEKRMAPDLIVQGPRRSVLSVVLGLVEVQAALDAGVLIPMVAFERFAGLRTLVGDELAAMALDHTDR